MRNDKLSVLSMRFSVEVIRLTQRLQSQHEFVISNQFGKSGTSIGANIREAQYGHSKPDFISKLQIALKEANETDYWLDLLRETEYISQEEHKRLSDICRELRITLIHSINTAKESLKAEKQ